MQASKLQLEVKGQEDTYLSIQPTNSLFQSVYNRLTNFAQDTHIVQPLAGHLSCNSRIEFRIPRYGDLLSNMYLNLKLSLETEMTDLAWVNSIGFALINSVDLMVGNNVITSITGKELDIWSEMLPCDKRYGVYRMVGKMDSDMYNDALMSSFERRRHDLNLTIPIPFWFTKHISCAFPMFLLKSETLRVTVNLNPIENCIISKDVFSEFTYEHKLSAMMYFHYIVLDSNELSQLKKSKTKNRIIIEQTQIQDIVVPNNANAYKFKLDFDHPIKELKWVVQRNDRNETKQDTGCVSGGVSGGVSRSVSRSDSRGDSRGGLPFEDSTNDQLGLTYYGNDEFNYNSYLNYHQPLSDTIQQDCDESHLFSYARLYFNNNPRTSKLPADYYRYIQPLQHHQVIPGKNIYCYNFGINADHFQPNGYCNFSPMSSIQMEFHFNNTTPKIISIFGHSYNLLIFDRGAVRLCF